jgi:oxygen-independent coproporphyrinogen-3 oxidase
MSEPFGVYVHIPFCSTRCDYCAFATWTDRSSALQSAYVDACVAEVERSSLTPSTSVFFGGGTPSLLPASSLLRILSAVPLADGAEVTVECNPDTVTRELLSAYRAGGVTRLSFGVQSMVPSVLQSLGRTHDPANVAVCASLARSLGFESWSMDLIFGAAGESLASWRATLSAVLALEPPPVSAYALTVEPGTPLAMGDPSRHPSDDDQADKYLLAESMLSDAGYSSYEISNWGRSPADRCRHNLLYWSQGDYRGIGCAAHSHVGGRRWWNVRTPERYVSLIGAGSSVEAAGETLSDDERRLEGLQLSLRTSAGVPVSSVSSADRAELDGLVEEVDGRLRLTPRGRLLANEVAVRLR